MATIPSRFPPAVDSAPEDTVSVVHHHIREAWIAAMSCPTRDRGAVQYEILMGAVALLEILQGWANLEQYRDTTPRRRRPGPRRH